jgi:hypothetical protein
MSAGFSSLSVSPMNEVTHLLSAIDQGDPRAAAQLLPLVYDELRQLAAQKLAQEKPGQTLQATALVHEAYLRLVGGAEQPWNSRNHFLCAVVAVAEMSVTAVARVQISSRVLTTAMCRDHPDGQQESDPENVRFVNVFSPALV